MNFSWRSLILSLGCLCPHLNQSDVTISMSNFIFVLNTDRISGPKRSIQISIRFSCTSANVIYCITCTFCKKLYIDETGGRLGDRFRTHLCDVDMDERNVSKPVARHFNFHNLPHHIGPSAAFHCPIATRKAAKIWNKYSFFKSTPSIPTV